MGRWNYPFLAAMVSATMILNLLIIAVHGDDDCVNFLEKCYHDLPCCDDFRKFRTVCGATPENNVYPDEVPFCQVLKSRPEFRGSIPGLLLRDNKKEILRKNTSEELYNRFHDETIICLHNSFGRTKWTKWEKEDKAKEDKAKEDKAIEDKAKEDKAKEDKAKEDKANEDKAKEDKAWKYKAWKYMASKDQTQ